MKDKDIENILDDEETEVKQETELGSVMNNLDSDVIDSDGMSKIDFNARLSAETISACIVFDELKRMGLLPEGVELTRTLKRLSVSKDGLGRREKVEIVAAERGNRQGIGFGERFASLFTRRQ